MNKQQVRYLLTILKGEYENSYKDFETIASTWDAMFKNDDYKYIAKAVYRYIETNATGFKPQIGQLKALAKEIKREDYDKRMREQELLPAPKTNAIPMPEELKEKFEKLFTFD